MIKLLILFLIFNVYCWRNCEYKKLFNDDTNVKLISMEVSPSGKVHRGDTVKSKFHLKIIKGEIKKGTLKVVAYKGIIPLIPFEYDIKKIFPKYTFPLKVGDYYGELEEKVPIYVFQGSYTTKAKLFINEGNNVICGEYDIIILK